MLPRTTAGSNGSIRGPSKIRPADAHATAVDVRAAQIWDLPALEVLLRAAQRLNRSHYSSAQLKAIVDENFNARVEWTKKTFKEPA